MSTSGAKRRERRVEEQHVLDEQHQFLRQAGAVAEQLLDDVAHLLEQLLGRDRERVDGSDGRGRDP